MARSSYLLYVRHAGIKRRKVYYAAFWDAEKQKYIRRSTGTSSPADAEVLARKWFSGDGDEKPSRLFSPRRSPYLLVRRRAGIKKKGGIFYVYIWSARNKRYIQVSTKSSSRERAKEFADNYMRRFAGRPPGQRIRRDPADKSGYVYFVIKDSPDGDCHLTKIGKSYNRHRPKNFSLPFKTHILYFETSNMHRQELWWQAQFNSKRVQSEWFALSADDLAFIERGTRESA